MDQKFFRYEEHVPSVYVNESRDMQMLLRLWTYGLSGAKLEAEELKYLNAPLLCNDRVLNLLSEKVQFMDSKGINSEILRLIDNNFSALLRSKGTEGAIRSAVFLYLKAYKMYTDTAIYVDQNTHEVWIGINSVIKDVYVLETILKYIIPTGYILHIYFYEDLHIRMGFRLKNQVFYLSEQNSSTSRNIYWIKKQDDKVMAIKYPSATNIMLNSLYPLPMTDEQKSAEKREIVVDPYIAISSMGGEI